MTIFKEKISEDLTINFHVTVKDNHIIKTTFKAADEAAFFCTIELDQDNPIVVNKILTWLKDYINKKPSINLPLLIQESDFKLRVYQSLLKLEIGKTASYQDIALEIGSKNAARAIGNACNKNPFPLFIPCHRVICSNGKLGGYNRGMERKKEVLEEENIFS